MSCNRKAASAKIPKKGINNKLSKILQHKKNTIASTKVMRHSR